MDEILTLGSKLSSVGFPTLLIFILYGSYKGVWVWGSQYQKCEAESQGWKVMALKAVGLAEKSTDIASARREEQK